MPNIADCRVLCRILLGICYPETEMRKQHKHTTNRTRTHTMTTNKMK